MIKTPAVTTTTISTPSNYVWSAKEKRCPSCEGTGRDRNGWRCWRCAGFGHYPVVVVSLHPPDDSSGEP